MKKAWLGLGGNVGDVVLTLQQGLNSLSQLIDHYLSKSLTLPHPFLTERSFVLRPLCEIAPELIIKGLAVKEWNQRVHDNDIVVLPTQYQQEISFITNISSDE